MPSDDRSATAEELLAHSRWVKRLARRLVVDAHVADDVEQQTWTAAIEKPPANRSNLRAWLGRVLRRRLYDLRRGERRRLAREQRARRTGSSPAPDELLERAETRAGVAQAVLTLEEPYRSTVLLRYFEEVSPRRIAALQDVAVSTVHTRLARGLDLLRARLRKELGREGDGQAWRYALLPVAGWSPITSPVASLGSLIVTTTTARTALVLSGVLLLVGLAAVVSGFLLDDVERAPDGALAEVERAESEAPDAPATSPRLEGVATASTGDPEAGDQPPATGQVTEGAPSEPGVVDGRVENQDGRPVVLAMVLLWDEASRELAARANADVRGGFHFDRLKDGPYRLAVYARGGAQLQHVVRPGGPSLVVTLQVAADDLIVASDGVKEGDAVSPGVVAGRVVDETDRPVAEALVMLAAPPSTDRRVHTDEDGRFHVEGLDEGPHVLHVHAVAFAPLRHPVPSGGGYLEIVLDRGPTIAGVVVDEASGQPVPGLPVRALGTTPGVPIVSTQTAQDGSFVLGGLSPVSSFLDLGAASTIRVGSSAEYVLKRVGPVAAGTRDLRVEMVRGLAIAGEIRAPDGTSWLSGAVVRVTLVAADGTVDYGGQRSAPVDAEGAFRVPGLPPGRYDVTVVPKEEEDTSASAALAHVSGVAAGRADLVIELQAGTRLEGRLVDETETPVRGKGWVWIAPMGTAFGEPGSAPAEVLEGGRFRSAPLDAGRAYSIRASGFPGYQTNEAHGVHPGDADLVIELERGFRIEGRVVTASGQPAPRGVPVAASAVGDLASAVGKERWAYAWVLTTEGGRFVLGGLREIPYGLRAGGGYSGLVMVGAWVTVGAPAKDVTLRVEPGAVLHGRLVDTAGEGIQGISIFATPAGGGESAFTSTRPDGSFDIKGVAAGKVVLRARIGSEHRLLGTFEAPALDLRIEIDR